LHKVIDALTPSHNAEVSRGPSGPSA
jgi:hypothetical protein